MTSAVQIAGREDVTRESIQTHTHTHKQKNVHTHTHAQKYSYRARKPGGKPPLFKGMVHDASRTLFTSSEQ